MADNTTAQAGFRTYIGLRYVPIIAGLWDITKDYEQLMIVTYQGNSYTSKKPVPAGIPLTDDEYWVMTGNYNVQVANLQNEVEVAVRQILDYATDFETFKTQMMKLYTDFTVDADGKVLEKVEEYKNILGEQYEAFIQYVNNVLAQYRDEMSTFTTETNQKIEEFISSSNTRIDNKFTTYESQINNTVSNYYNDTLGTLSNLQGQVDNLVLGAGNPQATSAEIEQARDGYDLLYKRLDNMTNTSMHYIALSAPSGVIDFNGYTKIGIYTAKNGTTPYELNNTPFGDGITNEGFTLVVYGDVGNNSFTKQSLNIIYQGEIRTFERIRKAGAFEDWRESVTAENVMLYSLADIVSNLNTMPINSCISCEPFTTETKPSHCPDVVAGDRYTVMTFGLVGNNVTQLVYTGTNNRCFIRRRVNGTWTNWDYLTNKDDVDSALATFAQQTITVRLAPSENDEHTPIETSYNFNSRFGVNTLVTAFGYAEGYEPTNAPNIPAETPYKVLTVGDLDSLYQFVVVSNGKSYFRFKNSGAWGNWFNVSGVNDLGNINDLTALNALSTDETFNVAYLASGILPNGDSGLCYIYNDTTVTTIHQTVLHHSGRTYYRYNAGGIWHDFTEPYNTNVVVNYNPFGGNGVPIGTLNSQIVSNIDYFTSKIIGVKFDGDVIGDTTPNADDQKGYLITSNYEAGGIAIIHQTYVTFNGRVFVRSYNGTSQQWTNFSTPYYTKSEIDTMLQNI